MNTFPSVDNTSVQKRNIEQEISSNKKVRIDISSSSSTWVLNSNTEQNLNVSNSSSSSVGKKPNIIKSQAHVTSEHQSIKDTMAQDLTDDIVIVKNVCKDEDQIKASSSNSSLSSKSDAQTTEYVVLSSALINSIDSNEYLVSTTSNSSSATTLESLNNCTPMKEVANVTLKSSSSLETVKSTESKKSIEDIELVLVSKEDNLTKVDGSSGGAHNNPNRIASDSGTSKLHTPTMINKINLQQNMPNKPVMVSTKKFMQDVMQTTAKVSIGNTTISVPLLKPLNSKQLLNSSFTLDAQNKAHSIKYQQTAAQPKAQLNLSKILNIKRSQKGGLSQPTIVSLSQLQIKPVSNAKIVQAKVLNKKIPLQVQVSTSSAAVASSLSSSTSIPTHLTTAISNASVTQISSKTKQNIMRNMMTNIGPANIHNISTGDTEKNQNVHEVDAQRHSIMDGNAGQTIGETIQKSTSNTNTILKSTIAFTALNQDKSKCLTTVKKICSSNEVSQPPLLTPLGGKYSIEQKSQQQQQTIGITSSGVSIVKQNSTQQAMITTSAFNTSICSTVVSECNNRNEMLTNKTTVVRSSKANSKNNTPIVAFPKNISLMLTKSAIPQQSKSALGNKSDSTIGGSGGVLSSKIENNSKCGNISITSIKNMSDGQAQHSAGGSEHIVLTTTSTSNNLADLQENKSIKVGNTQVSGMLESQAIKRIKLSSDDDDNDYTTTSTLTTATVIPINSKRQNLKIMSKTTLTPSNRIDGEFENIDEIEKKHSCHNDSELRLSTALDSDNGSNQLLTVTSHHGNTSTNITTSTTTIPTKSEETHNVLLKQLLQNCTTIPSANPNLGNNSGSISTTPNISNTDNGSGGGLCSRVLPNRKVTNMRAPSLGLVSSLEAQLARPVIPPVPASTNTTLHRQNDKKDNVLIFVSNDNNTATAAANKTQISNPNVNSPSESKNETKETKLKSSPTHLISKETSFVSNPSGLFSSKHDITPSTTVNTNSVSANQNNNQTSDVSPDVNKKEKFSLNIANQTEMTALEVKTYRLNSKEASATDGTPENTGNSNSVSSSSTSSKLTYNACIVQPTKTVAVGITETVVRKEKLAQSKQTNDDENLINSNDNRTIKTMEDGQFIKEIASVKQKNIATMTAVASVDTSSAGTTVFRVNADKSNHTVVKDLDARKKRKREYQKQRRQTLSNNNNNINNNTNNNKEIVQTIQTVPVANNLPNITTVANNKRKQRKISKIEEDYDSFIDNLMIKMRQMTPLEVQEPLLNKNISIGNEKQMTRSILNKTIDNTWKNSLYLGEYGCVNHTLYSGIYDSKNGNLLNYAGQNVSAIQNDFYDQEFVPVMSKNEGDKLTKFISVVKDRNLEVLNTINDKCIENADATSSQSEQKYNNQIFSQMTYPGLVVTNKSNCENLGRMSPIVHIVKPTCVKRTAATTSPSLVARHCLTNVKAEKKRNEIFDPKFSKSFNQHHKDSTVIVSLHLLSSENVLNILRDLANILNISPLTNYNLYEHNSDEKCTTNDLNNLQCQKLKKEITYSSLQKIISGKRRICSTCGNLIQSVGVRLADAQNKTKLKFLQRTQLAHTRLARNIYFCDAQCYKQYKARTTSAIDKKTIDVPENANRNLLHKSEKDTSKTEPNINNNKNNSNLKKSSFKYFNVDNLKPVVSTKSNSDKDLMDMLLRLDITVTARNSLPRLKGNSKAEEDTRQCILCSLRGDGLSDGSSRLLNFEVDKWVHLNCALWSNGVYETVSGGLMNLQTALHLGMNQICGSCHTLGATIKCFKNRCGAVFHLPCALKNQSVFYKNKTIQCAQHASRTEKENELTSLTVHRRVFVERDENCQVAAVMHHHTEQNNLLRVGSLTFLNVGQLLPHQLEAFHTSNHIYPIGYKIIRLYWSMKRPNKRCRYLCSITEVAGHPEFRIQVQEATENEIEFRDTTPNAVWQRILDKIAMLRKESDMVQLFPKFITGEDLFGLTEPTIVRIIESLPGIENLTDYRFKYGRNPLLELPLAVNPSGSARTEPKQRQLLGWRKPHTQRSATTFNQRTTNTSSIAGEVACPYSKQFVHSKSSQYKKMKQEWRNNVYLARSKIQGLGLYAARDIEKHTMIIEYIGEVIRTEVSEIREKQYEAKNRGIYMFRLDEDRVVDATLSGGLARYINHSCNPNCVTETVEVDRELRIIIFAKRRINRSEELSYDYKFDIEDDAHKIPCMCGTPNCRKWMN